MTGHTVLVGGFSHETNTFSPTPADRAAFQDRQELIGEEIEAELHGTNTAVGGVIEAAVSADVELIYTVAASAMPSGPVTTNAYEHYTGLILQAVRANRDRLDGVILPLHGAMVTDHLDDGEGPFVAAVKDLVGADVPVAVTLDLHGNVTDELCERADILVAYETYPHVDMAATGKRGMRLLVAAMRDALDPVIHVERPPVLAYGPRQNTRDGPMAEVMALARLLEGRDTIAKINVLPGFHAADIPSMGCSVPVVADGNPNAARQSARAVAEAIWERRDDFVVDYPSPREAVARAKALVAEHQDDAGPVVLADVGDNPGGGGTGDETPVLRAILEQGLTNAAFATLADPEAVTACVDAGVRDRVTCSLGGSIDGCTSEPIPDIDGYVRVITDGRYVNTGPMATGTSNDLGRSVRFECGQDGGVTVLLTERALQPLDAEIWRHHGIQPERLDVLVVKSTNHYRADYESMAAATIPVDSPGLASMNPRRYDYTRIRRPQYPLDVMAEDDYPD